MSFKLRFRWRKWMRKNSPIVLMEDLLPNRPSVSFNLQEAYDNPIIVSTADSVVEQLAVKQHDLIIFEPFPSDAFSVEVTGDYLIFFEDEGNQDTVLYMKDTVYSQTPLIIALPTGNYNFQGIKTFTADQLKTSYDEMFRRTYTQAKTGE